MSKYIFIILLYLFVIHNKGFSQQLSPSTQVLSTSNLFKKGSLIVQKFGKQGLVSRKKKVIIPIIYKKIIPVQKNLAIVQDTNGYYGCYNSSSVNCIPCAYDSLIFCNDSLFIVKRNFKYGLLTKSNQLVLDIKYKSIFINSYGNTLVEKFNHYAIIRPFGDTIHIEGDELSFVDSLYHYSFNGMHLLLNHEGQTIGQGDKKWMESYDKNVSHDIDTITQSKTFTKPDSLLPFEKDGLYGLANAQGDTVLLPIFDYVFPLKDSLCIFKSGKKYGFANKYGTICLLPYADSLRILNPHSVLYKNNNYWCILDENGFIKSDTLYECIEEVTNNQCFYTQNGIKNGMIGYQGNSIISGANPYLLTRISEGMLTIKNENQYLAIVGKEGRQLLDTSYQYQEILDFQLGYARVKKFDKYGFIDKNGGLTIATQYPQVGTVINNRVAVMIKNKWAVVDGWEKMICQPYYSQITDFTDSVAIASRDGKFLLIDYYGKELFIPKYESIKKLYQNIYVVYKGRKAGLINGNGHEFVFTKYDSIVSANDKLVIYKNFGKFGVLSINDQVLSPPKYENLMLHPQKWEYIVITKGTWDIFRF